MSVHCKRVYMSKAATAKPPTLWRLRLCACVRAIHTRAHAHTSEYLYECMVENVGCPEIENRRRNKVIYCLKIEKKACLKPTKPTRRSQPQQQTHEGTIHEKQQQTVQTNARIHSLTLRATKSRNTRTRAFTTFSAFDSNFFVCRMFRMFMVVVAVVVAIFPLFKLQQINRLDLLIDKTLTSSGRSHRRWCCYCLFFY